MTKLKDDYTIKDIIANIQKYSSDDVTDIEKAYNYVSNKVSMVILKRSREIKIMSVAISIKLSISIMKSNVWIGRIVTGFRL